MSKQKVSGNEGKPIYRIRRCVLSILYEYFKEVPYATIELSQISKDCRVSPKELNWNMVYLEKCGFVELAKSYTEPPFVSPSVVITAEGIELLEDENKFDKRFPMDQPGEP